MDYDIDSYEFKYICEIKPEVDLKGDFLEFSPQYLYNNQDNIPLNRYGKGPFCKFKITNEYKGRAGVYIIKINGEVKYIGECEDLSDRYNIGYGQISPRNCFIGGQPTNCKINAYILNSVKSGAIVQLLFYETQDRFNVERILIEKYNPEWNSTKGKYINSDKMKRPMDKLKENIMNSEGKYYALEQYLDGIDSSSITLSFEDIERIIGESLPSSARTYVAWWANNSKGHSHANAWLNIGAKVERVKLGGFVVFSKLNEKVKDTNQRIIKIGKKYRHFKGKEYLVLHLAKHSETIEDLVVYQALYGERGIWVRPLDMFVEQVEVNGKFVNRFEEVED